MSSAPHGPLAAGEDDVAAHAAGGVVWRHAGAELEVVLVHRPRYDDWSFPKGKVRRGEPALAAAYREVGEETGLAPTLGPSLPQSRYQTEQGKKLVEYWAMRSGGAPGHVTGDEVDRMEWLALAEARERLSYGGDRELLDELDPLVYLISATVLLMGHAPAGDPRAWEGDDWARPLDAGGLQQAEALRRGLPAFSPTRLLSADRARCVQTLEPLARDLGLPVELEACLGEQEYLASPDEAGRRVVDLARGRETTVLCAQGTVIRHLLATFSVADNSSAEEVEEGSVWALFFGAGEVVVSDYYPTLLGWPAPT